MADYNDKWQEFYDAALAKDDDSTRVFDTKTGAPIESASGSTKEKGASEKKKSIFGDAFAKDKAAEAEKTKTEEKPKRERAPKKEKASKEKTPSPRKERAAQRRAEENEGNFPVRFRRERRVGSLGGVVYFIFILAMSTLLACVLWFAASDVLALGKEEKAVEITIPENYTVDEVAQILYENGVINNRKMFKIYDSFADITDTVKPGTYLLYTNYDYRAVVSGLGAAGTRVSVKVTVPEGYTLRQTFALLEENGVCTAEKLWDCAANFDFDYDFLDSSTLGNEKRLEGYLFPDTYDFYLGEDPDDVIKKFLANFNNRFDDELVARLEETGYSMHDVVVIASLIEEEAAGEEDRAMIASVIYNRLGSSNFPYLQFDSTIHYIIAETGEDFSTEIDSPYNTYKYGGLPEGAISNPGMAAINAALYPEDTNYYYYALDIYGEHRFFTNYDSFLNFVNSSDYAG